MNFKFYLPKTNLHFGKGILKNLGEEVRKYGQKALLVTGKTSMEKLGILGQALDSLQEANIKTIHFGQVIPNPTTKIVDKGAKIALEKGCQVIIGLGGGSSIDAAKAIAIVAGHSKKSFQPLWTFSPASPNPQSITSETLPTIAITSTSGTGSHTSRFAVITNPETKEKCGLGSEYIFPQLSLVDLDILKHTPPLLTAVCGVDVLAHCFEGLVSKQGNSISEELALESIALIFNHLPLAYRDSENLRSREGMALADTYAGWILTTSRVILPHAMSHPVSAYYPKISHGAALAALLPPLMEFIINRCDENTFRNIVWQPGLWGKKWKG